LAVSWDFKGLQGKKTQESLSKFFVFSTGSKSLSRAAKPVCIVEGT
jgi:hypothetical protein